MGSAKIAEKLIKEGVKVDVEGDCLKKVGFWKGVKISVSKKARNAQVARISDFAEKALNNLSLQTNVQERVECFSLAETIVKKYAANKRYSHTAKKLDHLIKSKQNELWQDYKIESQEFIHPSNQRNFSRWIKWGFSPKVFLEQPDFANFLLDTPMGRAMGVWGDSIQFVEGQPHLLVNGQLKDWKEVKEQIVVKYHPESRTKRMYDKNNQSPLEYLGGGKGLVECDRYHIEELPVVTTISEEERGHLLELGRAYCRPSEGNLTSEEKKEQNATRDYVLQVVSTNDSSIKATFSNLFNGPKHPYFRLISPNREVKIVSYMMFNNHMNVLKHGKGAVSSPDFGEFCNTGTQYVTNIAIDNKEAAQFESIIKKISQDKEAIFNFGWQNCSTFIKHVLTDLKLADVPKPLPVARVPCDFLRYGRSSKVPLSERLITNQTTDKKHNKVVRVIKAFFIALAALVMKPFTLMLGDRPFHKFSDQDGVQQSKMTRFFKWLIEPVAVDFPGQIIAWQQTVNHTETFEKQHKIIFSSLSAANKQQLPVETASIPGFGTPAPIEKNKKNAPLANRVAAVAKNIIYYGTGLALLAFFIDQICNKINAERGKTTLHPEMVRHNEQEGPKVGSLVKTDVRVINKTDESYQFKLKLLDSAEQSIDISFNFAGGEHFSEVLTLVEKKMKNLPDFKVHFILSPDLLDKKYIDEMERLKGSFKNRFHYLLTTRHVLTEGKVRTEENHVKSIVVDGKYFVIGGTGIHDKMDREMIDEQPKNKTVAESMIDSTFRDTDVIGCGELAKTIRGQFYNLYQIWAIRTNHKLLENEGVYTPLDPMKSGTCDAFHKEEGLIQGVSMKFLVSGSEHKDNNPITKAIVHEIENAKKDIQIANLYFNPATEIKQALAKKKKEGKVEIEAVLNGVGKDISSAHYNYLLTNHKNLHLINTVYEYNVPDRLFHKKVAVFDDHAIVGSYNWGKKSAYCDNECVVLAEDPRFAAALKAGIADDKHHSKIVKSGKCNKAKILTRALSPIYTLGGRLYG